MDYQIGLGKQDLTCFIPGIGMMGYGQFHNVVKEIATPLWARVLFIKNNNQNFILVHLEQAFVTLAIKEEVLKRLNQTHPDWNMSDDNLAITAQHTHSAPGGYSHYPFYNMTIPGFQTKVFSTIVSAIMRGIEESTRGFHKVNLSWGQTTIDPSKEVAFNRSIEAHALNPEAVHSKTEEKNLAVDRTMEGLFFKNAEGKTLAFLNWFGVHCTSVSSFNQRIHHDNKGIAADLFEKNHHGTMAFFLQASAGDVSPNFFWDKKTKLMRGKFSDQYESAAYNGEIQFREAEKIVGQNSLSVGMESHQVFLDMSLEVAPPAHGVAFFQGTLEGPGVNKLLGTVLKNISRLVRKNQLLKHPELHKAFYEAHGAKDIVLDNRTGAFLGMPIKAWKMFPPLPEPTAEEIRKAARNHALDTVPWVPSILPFQVLRLGEVLIAFVPGEISVMAGRRLKNHLSKELQSSGVKQVFLTSYANAYMGYIVTPEEYDQQCYEGGHTVYGRETLRGIFAGFNHLIDMMKGKPHPGHLPKEPFHFPEEELARRSV